MARSAFTVRAPNSNTCDLDRFLKGRLGYAQDRTGDSSLSPARANAALPGPASGAPEERREEGPSKEQEVVLHEVWSQLSVPERQRFGHCFSFMVLKALGLRPCSAPEVQS
jgi:hypothetical protein